MAAIRVNHAILLLLIVAGAFLMLLGFLTDLVGMNWTAGFLGLYGMIALLMGSMGYLAMFSIKRISRLYQRGWVTLN